MNMHQHPILLFTGRNSNKSRNTTSTAALISNSLRVHSVKNLIKQNRFCWVFAIKISKLRRRRTWRWWHVPNALHPTHTCTKGIRNVAVLRRGCNWYKATGTLKKAVLFVFLMISPGTSVIAFGIFFFGFLNFVTLRICKATANKLRKMFTFRRNLVQSKIGLATYSGIQDLCKLNGKYRMTEWQKAAHRTDSDE